MAMSAAPALADVKSGADAWARGDFSGAVKEWRALADKGDPDAQFNMGQAYKLGRGVPADLRIAQSWYQKAAAQGHDQAQANLGLILFESGQRAAAMPWIRKAADRGDPRAQYVLGTAMFNGDIVARDWPRAYALMTRAAAQGLPQAASSLTQMDKYIPLAERQKGIALAQQMARGGARALAALPPPRAAGPAAIVPAGPAPRPNAAAARVAPPASKAPAAIAARPVAGGAWRAQLGAYASPAAAQAQWSSLSRRIPALAGLRPSYEQAGKFTRLRVGPLATRAAADRVCAASKSAGQACFPVAK
ncbi:MAG: sel1 repeat family protein [Actinomycetota bacterium]|nr:sel1 repeat family protein [Actinomycetota bacterium]